MPHHTDLHPRRVGASTVHPPDPAADHTRRQAGDWRLTAFSKNASISIMADVDQAARSSLVTRRTPVRSPRLRTVIVVLGVLGLGHLAWTTLGSMEGVSESGRWELFASGWQTSKDGRIPVQPEACPNLGRKRVPQEAIDAALENPTVVYGWGLCQNPNLDCSDSNPYRRWLTLSNPNTKYDRVWNGLVYKAGCP